MPPPASTPTPTSASPSVDRRMLLGVTGLAGLAVAARLAKAGPINPPPGPVAPTGKTLSEVEPRTALSMKDANPNPAVPMFTIQQNGSYYLAEDLVTFNDRRVIEITASAVTLDLNGFTVGRPFIGSISQASGIVSTSNTVHIHNGTVSGCGDAGLRVFARGGRIANIAVHQNGEGMTIAGPLLVEHCTATNNARSGFDVSSGARASGCIASGNGQNGFVASFASLHACIASQNQIDGFTLSTSHATDCLANENLSGGFRLALQSRASDCTADSNAPGGLVSPEIGIGFNCVGALNRVERCSAINNAIGFAITPGSGGMAGNFLVCNYGAQNSRGSTLQNYLIPATTDNPAIGPIVTNLALATNPFSNIEG